MCLYVEKFLNRERSICKGTLHSKTVLNLREILKMMEYLGKEHYILLIQVNTMANSQKEISSEQEYTRKTIKNFRFILRMSNNVNKRKNNLRTN